MNFRTVRVIRRGLRRGESGQAFAELTVSLVALLAVFVGFLLVASLSSERVSALVRAREDADRKSSSGVSSQAGESIRYWNYGEDGIPFTTDDHAVLGSSGDGALFQRQLTDNTGRLMMTNPPSTWKFESEFVGLQDSNLFVNAASLASGGADANASLDDHNIGSLESAAGKLFGYQGARIEERVYMPAHKDVSREGAD